MLIQLINLRADLRLQLIVRVNSLLAIIDIRVLSNVILIARLGILTRRIHLSRRQVLKGNTLLNRTSLNIIINNNLDINITRSRLRSELHRLVRIGLTNNRLISLVTQLRIQNVFLTRNQTLIVNMVSNNRATLKSLMLIQLINLRADLRLHSGRIRAASAVLIRQTRLINRDYALTTVRANVINAVRTHNGDKGILRLRRNFDRGVYFKLVFQLGTTRLYDTKARKLSKLSRISRKVCKSIARICITISALTLNNLDCSFPARIVREDGAQVHRVFNS